MTKIILLDKETEKANVVELLQQRERDTSTDCNCFLCLMKDWGNWIPAKNYTRKETSPLGGTPTFAETPTGRRLFALFHCVIMVALLLASVPVRSVPLPNYRGGIFYPPHDPPSYYTFNRGEITYSYPSGEGSSPNLKDGGFINYVYFRFADRSYILSVLKANNGVLCFPDTIHYGTPETKRRVITKIIDRGDFWEEVFTDTVTGNVFNVMVRDIDITDYMEDLYLSGVLKYIRLTWPEEKILSGTFCYQNMTSATAPEGATEIGPSAYHFCDNLVTFTIPKGYVRIHTRAFEGLDALKTVYLQPELAIIDKTAFYRCEKLENIDLSHVKEIGESAFEGCASLKSIKLREDSVKLFSECFKGCTGLESVTLPKIVGDAEPRFGEDLESGCNYFNLMQIAYAQKFGFAHHWFADCTSLKEVNMDNTTRHIPAGTFMGCTSLTTIRLPDSLRYIRTDAFRGCTSLETIHLPVNLRYIGTGAFKGCHQLREVQLPKKLREIGFGAFSGCDSLKSIVIPESVTSIGRGAFEDCTYMSRVTMESKNPPRIYYSAQDAESSETFNKKSVIFVPKGSVDDYKTDSEWRYLKDQIFEIGDPKGEELLHAVGIHSVKADKIRSSVFDLGGRRINAGHLQHGIYIVNGRKTRVK